MSLAFVDTETTGLHSSIHEVWEVGTILDGEEFSWFLPVHLERADPIALDIGRFHERHPRGNAYPHPTDDQMITEPSEFVAEFARLTHGRHLVGAVISFDEERLRRLLLTHHTQPSWHYHLVDVEALAAGKFGAPPPWDSQELSEAAGVNPDDFDRHTALGDARWAKAIYEAVMDA